MEKRTNKTSILLVDDNKTNLQVIANTLYPLGFNISLALSAEQALTHLEKVMPDIILLDIMMPEINGIELCKTLKQDSKWCDIPIIFVTAKTEQKDLSEAFDAGGADFITKPFNATELVKRVQNQLDLHQTKKSLQQTIATKDKLMSIVAHDLRGPLGSTLSILQMLKDKSVDIDPPKQVQLITMLESTTSGAYNLLQNLLEWYRAQTGEIDVEQVEFPINELVQSAVGTISSQLMEKSIVLQTDDVNNTYVYCDPRLISTVIRNIVSNAIKFTPEKGSITIRTKIVDNECVVSIQDSGIGMSQETITDIFDTTNHHTSYGTNEEKGTGLGIGICIEFMRLNNGKIWAESTLNEGSTFMISLPLKAAVEE